MRGGTIGNARFGKLRKINFPVFYGDNPKLWLSKSKDYFELCQVDPSMWIKVSTMHVTDSAARWLQLVEKQVKSCGWDEFSQLVLIRFGRD